MTAADLKTLTEAFGDPLIWRTVGISGAFGLLGGFAHRLGAPADDKTSPAAYLLLGMVSGIGVLYVNSSTDPLKVIALSVVAGYAGKAILNSLQARVEAEVSKRETAQAKAAGHKAVHAGKDAVDLVEKYADSVHEHGERIRAVIAKHPEKQLVAALPELRGAGGPLSPFLEPNARPESPGSPGQALAQKLTEIRGRLDGIDKMI